MSSKKAPSKAAKAPAKKPAAKPAKKTAPAKPAAKAPAKKPVAKPAKKAAPAKPAKAPAKKPAAKPAVKAPAKSAKPVAAPKAKDSKKTVAKVAAKPAAKAVALKAAAKPAKKAAPVAVKPAKAAPAAKSVEKAPVKAAAPKAAAKPEPKAAPAKKPVEKPVEKAPAKVESKPVAKPVEVEPAVEETPVVEKKSKNAPDYAYAVLLQGVKRLSKTIMFIKVDESEDRSNKKKMSSDVKNLDMKPTSAIRHKSSLAEETQEELTERILKELEEQNKMFEREAATQMCTRCNRNLVSPEFWVDKHLGFCEECAAILKLGQSKEARKVEYQLGAMDGDSLDEEDDDIIGPDADDLKAAEEDLADMED